MSVSQIVFVVAGVVALLPQLKSQEAPVDFNKAREYFERRKSGGKLTPDEEVYVRRAVAERQRQQTGKAEGGIDWERAQRLHRRAQNGETLSAEEQAYYEKAKSARRPGGDGRSPMPAPVPWTQHLTPLTELGLEKYKGEDGGLYGGGSNMPPPSHLEAALKLAAKVRPLDAEGRESADGKIGLLSVGMSNTTLEYSRFKQLADADPAKAESVVVIDGAQGGQTALRWADPDAPLWARLDERLRVAGLGAKQIQVAWMKQAEAGPAQFGEFPKHARQLQENLTTDLVNLKGRFPNLQLVYLSSRIYGGYATNGLNPEPYAYEGAFSMRWLIQDQIAGKPELNWDPAKGVVNAPLLLWGPYLWADRERPRKADGLAYQREDLRESDGTHPSDSARQKVAALLLDFFKTDPTAKPWFAGEFR